MAKDLGLASDDVAASFGKWFVVIDTINNTLLNNYTQVQSLLDKISSEDKVDFTKEEYDLLTSVNPEVKDLFTKIGDKWFLAGETSDEFVKNLQEILDSSIGTLKESLGYGEKWAELNIDERKRAGEIADGSTASSEDKKELLGKGLDMQKDDYKELSDTALQEFFKRVFLRDYGKGGVSYANNQASDDAIGDVRGTTDRVASQGDSSSQDVRGAMQYEAIQAGLDPSEVTNYANQLMELYGRTTNGG